MKRVFTLLVFLAASTSPLFANDIAGTYVYKHEHGIVTVILFDDYSGIITESEEDYKHSVDVKWDAWSSDREYVVLMSEYGSQLVYHFYQEGENLICDDEVFEKVG